SIRGRDLLAKIVGEILRLGGIGKRLSSFVASGDDLLSVLLCVVPFALQQVEPRQAPARGGRVGRGFFQIRLGFVELVARVVELTETVERGGMCRLNLEAFVERFFSFIPVAVVEARPTQT